MINVFRQPDERAMRRDENSTIRAYGGRVVAGDDSVVSRDTVGMESATCSAGRADYSHTFRRFT
jgi:hypothetical protein